MSESSAAVVGLVIDAEFGDRIYGLAQQMPVWVISSATNDRAIEACRAALGINCITTLLARAGETKDDLLGRAMYAIDEHHGEESAAIPYRTLLLYGAMHAPSEELASELGFSSVTATADGFRAEK